MFQKGKRLHRQGGRANGLKGGRPTKEQAEIKRMTPEVMREYIIERVKPVVDMYLALGAGEAVKVGKRKFKLKLDPATVRDIIDKFIPPAPKTLNLDRTKTAEDFYEEIMKEAGVDTSKGSDEPPDPSKLH
jgi:hypothetical protein